MILISTSYQQIQKGNQKYNKKNKKKESCALHQIKHWLKTRTRTVLQKGNTRL